MRAFLAEDGSLFVETDDGWTDGDQTFDDLDELQAHLAGEIVETTARPELAARIRHIIANLMR